MSQIAVTPMGTYGKSRSECRHFNPDPCSQAAVMQIGLMMASIFRDQYTKEGIGSGGARISCMRK